MKILIPAAVWETVLDEFARHDSTVERVAYLDGFVVDQSAYRDAIDQVGVVTTVVFPDAELHQRYYRVSPAAMQEAGRHLITHRMRRLGQVHTHGKHRVDHSPTDDDMAYSQQPGSLSLVLPFHASRRPAPTNASVGVHVKGDEWELLPAGDINNYLEVISDLIDHREPTCLASRTSPEPNPRTDTSKHSLRNVAARKWRLLPWNRSTSD